MLPMVKFSSTISKYDKPQTCEVKKLGVAIIFDISAEVSKIVMSQRHIDYISN